MKLQCSCGAKYAFEITPEMAQNPVKFICPNCGLDASDYVNQLVREELASRAAEKPLSETPPAPAPSVAVPPPASRLKISHTDAPAAANPSTPPPPPPPPSGGMHLRVSHEAPPPAAASEAPVSKFCTKHRERATEQCAICHKPICPKCLEMFGYFCSPLCKGKAEAQGIDVPVYAGRKDVVEAQFWNKAGMIAGVAIGVIALFVALWIWYAWFGSVPHKYFAVRFADDDRAYHGMMQVVGKDDVVFLHGGTLARYNLKSQKPIWTQELISKEEIAAAVKAEMDAEARAAAENAGGYYHRSSEADIQRSVKLELQGELSLRVAGQNVWVGKEDKMTRYDWATGNQSTQVTLPERTGAMTQNGDELLMLGAQSVTHISLTSGESRVEQFGNPGGKAVLLAQNDAGVGLGGDTSKPLDPKKVEAQVQNMKIQGKIALPALIANAQHERQLEAALNDDPKHPRAKNTKPVAEVDLFQLVSGPGGYAQFATKLLEERLVERTAMKAAPKGKSILDSGNVNGMNEGDAINEQLNEMQRNGGNDKVTEDESRYSVTVRLPDGSAPDFTNEVVGSPQLFVLKTVNVVAAGKTVIVLDKSNKKLWQATLTYAVPGGGFGGFLLGRGNQYGEGPCVEHGNTLYVFDQAVLTAFELNSGNARWRLPSVGVAGLFFDDLDNIYVNTTSASPDDIKYSKQIDINRRTDAVLTKVEPKTGKALWSVKPNGHVSYLSGKFIYVVDSHDPNPIDMDQDNDMAAALMKPAFLHITRINPKDGRAMFDYYDRERCPFYVHFNNNEIELIYKREVQVLRFLTL